MPHNSTMKEYKEKYPDFTDALKGRSMTLKVPKEPVMRRNKYTKRLEKANINLMTAMKAIAEATDDTVYKFYRFNAHTDAGEPMVLVCAVGSRAKELSKFLDDYKV